jgi:hypothetical protein
MRVRNTGGTRLQSLACQWVGTGTWLVDNTVSLIQSLVLCVDNYEHEGTNSAYSSCLSSSIAIDCNSGPHLPTDDDAMKLRSYAS